MSNPIKEQGLILVWSEEFDNVKSIEDTDFRFKNTMWNNRVEHLNDGRNVEFKDSCMILKSVGPAYDPKYFASLPSGLLTEGNMAFCGGYLEMRAKVPFKHGVWPSLWLVTEEGYQVDNINTEVDIFEVMGSTTSLECQLHKWRQPEHVARPDDETAMYTFPEGVDPEDWHLYGFEWTDTKYRFYVDNECYCEMGITDNDEYSTEFVGMQGYRLPHHIRMNNYVLSPTERFARVKDRLEEGDEFEFIYTIDYLRLYQDPTKHTLITKK